MELNFLYCPIKLDDILISIPIWTCLRARAGKKLLKRHERSFCDCVGHRNSRFECIFFFGQVRKNKFSSSSMKLCTNEPSCCDLFFGFFARSLSWLFRNVPDNISIQNRNSTAIIISTKTGLYLWSKSNKNVGFFIDPKRLTKYLCVDIFIKKYVAPLKSQILSQAENIFGHKIKASTLQS